ncbi:NADH:flavin oxidoreductase [Rhodococcus sp. NPDC003322]
MDVWDQFKLGPITLKNRIIKAATFEGAAPDGVVTDRLIEFHREMAAGGVAMTTVAYCAVSPGGRIHKDCLILDEATLPGLQRLTEAVHAEGAKVSAQIGHAGLVASPQSNGVPSVAPSSQLSLVAQAYMRGATEQDLQTVIEDYERATRVAVEAGFDCVEVHIGHNYLLSSFLSPNLNKRKDKYGGDIENRARFPREVLRRVRAAAGDSIAVIAKLNMTDGVPKGLWLNDSIPFAKMLEEDGSVDALELTAGSSLLNSMYLFRGDVPLAQISSLMTGIKKIGIKFVGKQMFKEYPYEDLFLMPLARQFREALNIPIILLGGVTSLANIDTALSEGFELVAMGRTLLRDPNLINNMQAGSTHSSTCIHCNRCMVGSLDPNGTSCPVRDAMPASTTGPTLPLSTV